MAKIDLSRASAAVLCALAGIAQGQVDLLPDIIVVENELYDNEFQTLGGRRYLRLSNATANIGLGKLHVYGGQTYGDGTQDVIQRVYRSDGSTWDRVAGRFIYHPGHGHIHVENWCQYSLRQYLDGGGVGNVVAQGAKTSFCILDLGIYDSGLPNFDPDGQFRSCGSTTQGLSVGWMDIYGRHLEGQAIDITGVPDGTYWLESYVDPKDDMLESNEDNNIARIVITIGDGGGAINPDAYEENDSRTQVDGRPVGQNNSPNFGPCNPERSISGLTIDSSGDDDWFKFYMPANGTSSDFVRLNLIHAQGDIDMTLHNSNGFQVAISQDSDNEEFISMNGRTAGWYYVRAYGFSGAVNPSYTLTINPSVSTAAPVIDVLTPPAGDTQRTYAAETYDITWTASDGNANPTWVTMYLNDTPTLDGTEIMLPSSLNTPGTTGFYVINSADFDPGTYWVYASITDGGTTTGAWSDGTISFVNPVCIADMSGSSDPNDPGYGVPDGELDSSDFFYYLDLFASGNADADLSGASDPLSPFYGVPDGIIDSADFFYFLDAFMAGCP